MILYKFTTDEVIAKIIAKGIFRFYDLTKYIEIEDEIGRSDNFEGSVSFLDKEVSNFPDRVPIASFNGIEFKSISISLDKEYLSQYFVFCMSTIKNDRAIGDCDFAVELDTDIFDVFEKLLPTPLAPEDNRDGMKLFSHGAVEYYDIHHHPPTIQGKRWKEIYMKRSEFSHQNEYRAAMFISDEYFERVGKEPEVYEKKIRVPNGDKYDFNLKLVIKSGIDNNGFRFLEFDISEFQKNLTSRDSNILYLTDAS